MSIRYGYYSVDVRNVGVSAPVKFMGSRINSWEAKHQRNCGKEVWFYGTGGWYLMKPSGGSVLREKPEQVKLMELIGAL